MAKIVDLKSFRDRSLEQKCFGVWHQRFGETFGVATRVCDLSDKTVFFLAQPGENSSLAFYELILGALDLGPGAKFYYLANDEQMRVVDIHLLLADQVRFEMMRRLGWLREFRGRELGLIEMVRNFEAAKQHARSIPPQLNETHPAFADFSRLTAGDKEVFIRRMLREAIDAFKTQLGD
ncbi:MAG: hypothetical protein EHM15_00435 [Desulfobacteraceae bacterium]|nr:MAG: hypothetical protein EHM15_00435 [Desulfobacteraceae bacterium]